MFCDRFFMSQHKINIHQVKAFPDAVFKVVVSNGEETAHIVTLAEDYYQKLTQNKVSAEELIRRSFEFLLSREPKESILRQFDLRDITRYFPEYENNLKKIQK